MSSRAPIKQKAPSRRTCSAGSQGAIAASIAGPASRGTSPDVCHRSLLTFETAPILVAKREDTQTQGIAMNKAPTNGTNEPGVKPSLV